MLATQHHVSDMMRNLSNFGGHTPQINRISVLLLKQQHLKRKRQRKGGQEEPEAGITNG